MAKQFNNIYYDIESLKDIFSLVAYCEKDNVLEIYYLLDKFINNNQSFSAIQETQITAEIMQKNKNFHGTVRFYNLYELDANLRLARLFGCYAPGYLHENFQFPITRDIDSDFDEEIHPYLMGYNSLNYDDTILSMYFAEIFPYAFTDRTTFQPTNPATMRIYNDELFHAEFINSMSDRLRCTYLGKDERRSYGDIVIGDTALRKQPYNNITNPAYYVKRSMNNSGRHIDVARLNEKQLKVALKRLLGMSGYQILESDTDLSSGGVPVDSLPSRDKSQDIAVMSFDDLKSLLAYNVSDCVNLKHLFYDKNYVATFQLKKQMLIDYPELIFEQIEVPTGQTATTKKWDKDAHSYVEEEIPVTEKLYKPDVRPEKMKSNRLTINSSSAQLAAACLCPYGSLTDEPCVSFLYPSKKKSEELGIPQVNVLDETEKFIQQRLVPRAKGPEGERIIQDLYKMIAMYRNIEGQDFNATHAPDNPELICDLKDFSDKVNVPYMGPDGQYSNCYVTFSVGGLHGAEYNQELYKKHCIEWEEKQRLFKRALEIYKNASNMLIEYNEKGKAKKRKFLDIDGVEVPVSTFVKGNCTLKAAEQGLAEFKPEFMNPKKPEIFKPDKDGGTKIDKKYVVTSFGPVNHEDFTSYYPSMLINMSAFENPGLGYDRYAEIFGNKEKFGKMMKDPQYTQDERDTYSIMRNGTKLILNSASGAADVSYNTPIRMNNRITAMRIIGQLFTWRIGQAQSLEGAQVISTNTDGLYTIFDEEENAKILEREAEAIHVGIEPEPIFIVSKDANNRWEGEVKSHTGNSTVDIKIVAASGGSLACMYGPNTSKSLNHPAIIDWALAEFLKWKALQGALDDYDEKAADYLMRYVAPAIFTDKETGQPDNRKLLQMYQNVIASSPKMGTYNFSTTVPITEENENVIEPSFMQHYNRIFYVDPKKVPEDQKHRIVYLAAAYMRVEKSDSSILALKVIKDLNNNTDILIKGTPKIKKINGIELNTPCIICNEDLAITDGIKLEWLDLDYYNLILKETYRKNWQNNIPTADDDGDDDDEA